MALRWASSDKNTNSPISYALVDIDYDFVMSDSTSFQFIQNEFDSVIRLPRCYCVYKTYGYSFGVYQPVSLVDEDYPAGRGLFTLVPLMVQPKEFRFKGSITIQITVFNKNMLPEGIPTHITNHVFRIPFINCNVECPDVLTHNMLSVLGLRKSTANANGVDLIFKDKIRLQPKGVYVFQLINIFKFRELECSPDWFILRSRISRAGVTMKCEPLKIPGTQMDDVSMLEVVLQNNRDEVIELPKRFMQYLIPFQLQNCELESLIIHSCNDAKLCGFLDIDTKARVTKEEFAHLSLDC